MGATGGQDPTVHSITDALTEIGAESASIQEETATGLSSDQEALQEVAEQTLFGEIFLADLISRQLALSFAVGLTFLATLFAIPLFNYLMPSVASIQVFGFTLSWLFLGVLVYPLIWGLAHYFVGTCKKFEDDFIRLVK